MAVHGCKRKRRMGIAVWPALCVALAAHGQEASRGGNIFDSVCAQCHGPDGQGGPLGPSIVERVATTDRAELAAFLRVGRPERGMPPALVDENEMEDLVAYLKSLGEAAGVAAPSGAAASSSPAAAAADGRRVEHSIAARIESFPPLTDAVLAEPDDADWLWFGRVRDGRPYSPLAEIDDANVHALRLAWSRGLPAGDVEPRAIVYAGVMFVVLPDASIAALDAATGDPIWQRSADESGLSARAAASVALELHGDTLYVELGDGAVALDARTGAPRPGETPPSSLPKADDVTEPAVLATAGGLVFRGSSDRRYRATDAETGDVLWETILGGPVSSGGSSFAVDGRQHIAVIVGTAARGAEDVRGDADPVPGAIYVFALPSEQDRGTGRKE